MKLSPLFCLAIGLCLLLSGRVALAQSSLLTVARSGTGTGTITSTPAGINCGADCTESYTNGTVVTLTASPASGSTFAGWSGGCTGTGACNVTINSAVTVTATFTLDTLPLTVSRAGTGTGTVTSAPAGINCGADCTENYNFGTVVTLTASPASGSTFAGWSGGCTGTGACNVTVTSAVNVTATFTLNAFTLTAARAGTGSGVVTSTPAGITCGADCTEAYNFGTVVTLTAAPNVGSSFVGWSGGGCSGTGSCVVTMTAATTVTATFSLTSPALTVSLAGSGAGVVTSTPAGINCGTDCSELYPINTLVTLTAIPNSGSTFAGWSGACSGVGSCSLTMNASQSVVATFTSPNATLTVLTAGSGSASLTSFPAGINCSGSVPGSGVCTFSFPTNTSVSVAALPANGTTIHSFTGADSSSGNVATVLLTGNRTITANLRCAADFNGSGIVSVQDIFDFLAAYFAGCP